MHCPDNEIRFVQIATSDEMIIGLDANGKVWELHYKGYWLPLNMKIGEK